MSFLSSIPVLSLGSGLFSAAGSLITAAVLMASWTLILLVLHPLHATLFILAALFEYAIISWFGFHLWVNFFSFFIVYILLFILYTLFIRKLLPLPKSEAEQLIKLAELKKQEMLTDEEFTAAKKRLLKLRR